MGDGLNRPPAKAGAHGGHHSGTHETPAFAGEQVRVALREAATQLDSVSATPWLDAEILLAHALGVERSDLLLDPVRYAVPDGFAALVTRRMSHEPVAYIVGYRDFWTVRIGVGPGVLIPRADSETLLEVAVRHFVARPPRRILDLGTGPGTLLLAALAQWPGATGLGIDVSEAALDYARANAAALGLAARAELRLGDWAAGIDGVFDLILCNPPYIADDEMLMPEVAAHEPGAALFAGADGLDDYRRIVPQLPMLLAPGGAALVEIGWTQAAAVTALVEAAGLAAAAHCDLGARDRVLLVERAAQVNADQ
jgi:release factor glutamine methyltransferase